MNILEIGVQSGGSSRVWREYFGSATNYIGIDINPNCLEVESKSLGIKIIIGSQDDETFLTQVCLDYGPFDLIVDDGGHETMQIITSLKILWGCLSDDAVYAIEDLHSMSMWSATDRKSMRVNGKDVYSHIADIARNMVSYFHEHEGMMMRREAWMDPVSSHISSIEIYDSLIFLHYRKTAEMLAMVKGGQKWISDKF